MSDILPPMHGPQVDKIFGKGSIALITDECLFALQCTRVNGVDGCIVLRMYDSRDCANVHPDIDMREKLSLLRELHHDGSHEFLTMPMCHRSLKDSWDTAETIFLELAGMARLQALKAGDKIALDEARKKPAKKKAKSSFNRARYEKV